ncbi:MAG: hypothetical protein K0S08_948 [Gammaproteobacteria bacterium]|jgi:hypothetical protein|nr:hypothetical protein [Gammaproteobacteria bacterium]
MKRRFLLALSMPVALILIVLIMVYWPSQQPTADENFIFSETAATPYCALLGGYEVEEGKIVWHDKALRPIKMCQEAPMPQLYLYNAVKKQVEPLDLKTAQMFRINPTPISPGGFAVSQNIKGGKFPGLWFLAMHSYNNFYLAGHGYVALIPAIAEKHQYAQFKFLGWIKA